MSVGERIKARRKQIGMSAETLAERIGKSPATVYRYEKGDIDKIDSRIIPRIARALGVEPGDLMGWSAEDGPNTDPMVTELMDLWYGLNHRGREALISQARIYSDVDDFKKDGPSSKKMV